jgi:hypothetical protein
MISTEEMIIMITKQLFAEMGENETDADVLEKVIGFLLMAYRSTHDPRDVAAVA